MFSFAARSSIPCSAQPSSIATCSEVPEAVHDPAPSTEISDSKRDPLFGTSSPPLATETFTHVPEPEHNQSPGTYPQPTPDNTSSDTPAQQKDTETPTQKKNEHKGEDIEESVKCSIEYWVSKDVHNPLEILRCVQRAVVSGRDLDITTISDSLEGEFNEILVNRYDILGSALEELQEFDDPRLTLKVNFYGETAEDSGGPRREFFRLCLQEIKSKYFDDGLKEHLAKDYKAIGQKWQQVCYRMVLYHDFCLKTNFRIYLHLPNLSCALQISTMGFQNWVLFKLEEHYQPSLRPLSTLRPVFRYF